MYFLITGRIVVKIQYQCDENICLCDQVPSYIHLDSTDKSRMWFVNGYMLGSNNSKDDFSFRNLLVPLPVTPSISVWMASVI